MKTTFSFAKIAAVAVLIIALLPTVSSAQDKTHKAGLDLIFKAFQTKNYELVKPILDPNVKISPNIPTGMNDAVIPQVLTQMPTPESYTVVHSEKSGANTIYTTEYNYKDKKRLQYFVFDANGKVIELDILRDANKVEARFGQ